MDSPETSRSNDNLDLLPKHSNTNHYTRRFANTTHTTILPHTKLKAALSIILISAAVIGIVLLTVLYKHPSPYRDGDKPVIRSPRSLVCQIFCSGDILHTVQLSPLFNDTKHFVDMPLKHDPAVIWSHWNLMLSSFGNDSTQVDLQSLRQFVLQHFDEPGSDLEVVHPEDWREFPDLLDGIVDPILKEYARQVNEDWKLLGRAPSRDVYENPSRHTLIPLKNRLMIVPGGRFLEEYYWDTYFVNKGLIASGMLHSAKLVTENLVDLVRKLGFVPNGARTYYMNRSQPPMLSLMVQDIVEAMIPDDDDDVDDDDDRSEAIYWLKKQFPALEEEYQFWMTPGEHAVLINGRYLMNRYFAHVQSAAPRPEMYREDFNLALNLTSTEDKQKLWANLIAAAETGWDFSSRWFADRMSKTSADTMNVIPVDLNVIMCKVEEALLGFAKLLKNHTQTDYYAKALSQRKEAISRVLWNSKYLQWNDHYLSSECNESQPLLNAASNFYPLWGDCFDISILHEQSPNLTIDQITQSLLNSGLILPGGISTTMSLTGQQWDFPNAWAPIQYILIEGLENLGETELSLELANRWIVTTFLAYNSTGYMHEKYDALILGEAGDGGEYPPQIGFGWTNGVTLDLLGRYGDKVHFE